MKTDQEILHEIEATRRHIRWGIKSIKTSPMLGAKVNIAFAGDEPLHRDLTLSDTNEEAVIRCLAQVFPEHYEDSQGDYAIRKNGQYKVSQESFEMAKNYIASNIQSEEELWVIEDNSGRITRFVANPDGSLMQLD